MDTQKWISGVALIATCVGCTETVGLSEVIDNESSGSSHVDLVRPYQWEAINSMAPLPDFGHLGTPFMAPDGAFAIQKYLKYEPNFVNGWTVRPTNWNNTTFNPNGAVDFQNVFGSPVILEHGPYEVRPEPAVTVVSEYLKQAMGPHLGVDIRFDTELVRGAIGRLLGNPQMGDLVPSVPYRSNDLVPNPQGNFWVYPFVMMAHTFQDPVWGASMGVRVGMVTMNLDKTQIIGWGTKMLEPFRPITTQDPWMYPPFVIPAPLAGAGQTINLLRGIEPTFLAIPGKRQDGNPTDIIGYAMCFHAASFVPPHLGDALQVYCTATASADPATGYAPPVPVNHLYRLAGFRLADHTALGTRLPIFINPLATPDGEPFDANEVLMAAYPWFDHTGGLYLRTSLTYGHFPGPPRTISEGHSLRGALQFISPEYKRPVLSPITGQVEPHMIMRVVEGLYDTRKKQAGLTATSAGQRGPREWHINQLTNPYAAYPATDFNSRLVCHNQFVKNNVTPREPDNYLNHYLRCDEDFFPPVEVRDPAPDYNNVLTRIESSYAWLTWFPGHEVYAQSTDPHGIGTRPDPQRVAEYIHAAHATFVGGVATASFPQEKRMEELDEDFTTSDLTTRPHLFDVDRNGGIRGQAPRFAQGGYMESVSPSYAEPYDALSTTFFVKPDAYSSWNTTLLNFRDSFIVRATATDIEATIKLGGLTQQYTVATPRPSLSDWFHIAVTWDGEQLRLFLDGVLAQSTATPQFPLAFAAPGTSATLRIGKVGATTPGEIAIDEIAVTAFAMAEEDVARMAYRRKRRAPTDPGLVSGINFPLGWDPTRAQIPDDNPLSDSAQDAAKRQLGCYLFHDDDLSFFSATGGANVSCATCHDPQNAYADPGMTFRVFGTPPAEAIARNSPSLLNAVFRSRFRWDGSASLEEQSVRPFFDPIEMGVSSENMLLNIIGAKGLYYRDKFQNAGLYWGTQGTGLARPTLEGVGKALATYIRSLVSGNSAYDRFVAGDPNALTLEEVAGMDLFFGKARCVACHRPESGFGAPPERFMWVNTGLVSELDPLNQNLDPLNGYGQSGVPPLRDISKTPPYFHNGDIATLDEVIRAYNRGAPMGNVVSFVNPDFFRPLGLTETEITQLESFLHALDSDTMPPYDPGNPCPP